MLQDYVRCTKNNGYDTNIWWNLTCASDVMYIHVLMLTKMMVLTQFMARYTQYTIMWSSLSVTCDRSVLYSSNPVSSTNKTDPHNITEIVLKVALNSINPNPKPKDDVRQKQDYNFLFYRFDWKLRWQSKTEVVPDCYMYLLEVKIIVRNQRLNLFMRQNSFGLSEDLPGELCIVNVTTYS